MADTGRRMNFAALKRADPYAKEIIDSATHVALYTFEENEWEKTNVEGALFVYSRNGEPYHSLVIMNRLNTNNLIEPISRGIELQLKEPFLLYRNAKCRIYGIWFYDKEECIRVANKLTALKDSMKPPATHETSANLSDSHLHSMYSGSASSSGAVDIFSMLSKAQDDFESTKGSASKCESTPSRAPDMASQSVMDFFAKAGCGAAATQMPTISTLPSPGIFGPRSADVREGPLLLQRLMSNPAHSVEHIEKQQRSVTPQDAHNSSNGNVLDSVLNQDSGFVLKSTPKEKPSCQRVSGMTGSAEEILETSGIRVGVGLSSQLNSMRLSPNTISPLDNFSYLNQAQDVGPPANSLNGGKFEEKSIFGPNNPLMSQQKPALMPPTMFTASSAGDMQHSLEPLNRNQLLQAFNYLLKHDADFVNKLHEAYVKSFSEKAFSVS